MQTWPSIGILVVLLILPLDWGPSTSSFAEEPPPDAAFTVLCYLNGDNDLSAEVLHALDMLETVGSSAQVNVVALVDGHERWLGPYAPVWARTRLLYVTADDRLGRIDSPVLEDWGEANLGDPRTLARFVSEAVNRYPARRYLFYAFAHSQGVIETRRLTDRTAATCLSISPDATDAAKMDVEQFRRALHHGLNGRRFDLTVLFACLANMVEVGYALSDVTDYLVASQDEIRLLNQPPGTFQIRGLPFEQVVALITRNPDLPTKQIGRRIVDMHVDSYGRAIQLPVDASASQSVRFAADMALVDCRAIRPLVEDLDGLSRLMITHADDPGIVDALRGALAESPRLASFLNLEYYDLGRFVQRLADHLVQPDLMRQCQRISNRLADRVLVHRRSTASGGATGMSVYLSHPLVPENVYQAHQAMYARSRFGRDTHWDEMIEDYRPALRQTWCFKSEKAGPTVGACLQ